MNGTSASILARIVGITSSESTCWYLRKKRRGMSTSQGKAMQQCAPVHEYDPEVGGDQAARAALHGHEAAVHNSVDVHRDRRVRADPVPLHLQAGSASNRQGREQHAKANREQGPGPSTLTSPMRSLSVR